MKLKYILLSLSLWVLFFHTSQAQCFVTSFSPAVNACTGQTMTINGIFALTGSTTPQVIWGGTGCSIQSYSSSKIVITLPNNASGISVSVRDKANCISNGVYSGIINQTPNDPISLSATLYVINQGQSTTLFVGGGMAGQTKWYANSCGGGTAFGTSPVSETVSPTVTTTYYVRNESLIGGCASDCRSITITVMPGGGGGNSIATGNNLSGGHLYNGCSISVSYSATGTFNSNNIFTVQLSDASGSFSSPTVIGSLTSTALSGNINAVIPAGITPGTGYRVRVVSDDPATIGTDNGTNLTIGPITVNSISSGTLCPGSTFDIAYNASPCLNYVGGNVFTAQLSDAFGNFSNPVNIGSVNSINASGLINATIPLGTSAGVGYRVRVVSTNPAGTGLEYGTALSIMANPTAAITPSGSTNLCGGGSVILTANSGGTYLWSNGNTNQSIQVNQSGAYAVTVTYGNNCQAVASPVSVSVNPIPPTPTAWSNSPVRFGDTVKLFSSALANATYHWKGPNSFTHTSQNPSMPSADMPMAGVYTVTDTLNGCGSAPTSTTIELYGQVTGKIKTETNVGVKKTVLLAAGTPNQNYLTDMTGNYTFDFKAGSSYTITPFKNNDSIKNNGITIADFTAVRNHVRGTRLLSTPYKIIAADVNSDGMVNITDLSWIRQMINNQYGLIVMGKLWSFVPHDYVFPNPQNPFPFPSSRTYTMTANRSTQDFIGMKLGDVNNSWNPNRSSTDTLEFSVPNLTVNKDSIIKVPVQAKNFRAITAFQFTMQWDPSVLTYLNVDTASSVLKVEYGEDSAASGKLVVSWIDEIDSSTTLADYSNLFYVRFRAIGTNNAVTPISINSEINVIEALDSTYENIEVETKDGSVTIHSGAPVGFTEKTKDDAVVHLYPNPFKEETWVSMELGTAQLINVETFDLNGKKVAGEQRQLAPGKNKFVVGRQLPPGTYFIHLKGKEFSKTIRAVKIH